MRNDQQVLQSGGDVSELPAKFDQARREDAHALFGALITCTAVDIAGETQSPVGIFLGVSMSWGVLLLVLGSWV